MHLPLLLRQASFGIEFWFKLVMLENAGDEGESGTLIF